MIRQIIDIFLLSFTIFAESSGECKQGQFAVANVIRNRTLFYHRTYTEIILQNNQFSCWNSNQIMKHINRFEIKPFRQCLLVSLKVYYNISKDNTKGSLWYVKTNISKSWMRDLKVVFVYGNHKFMKNKNLL